MGGRFPPTATNWLIAITAVMFLVQNTVDRGEALMGMNRLFLLAGYWFQPLTSLFIHGGLMHLVMNMAVFYHYGNLLEAYRGKKSLLLLYLGGGTLTSLLSFGFTQFVLERSVNLVGASGAISVVLGYVAAAVPPQRREITAMILVISFLPLLAGMPVAWYAHLIGFGLGWVAGMRRV